MKHIKEAKGIHKTQSRFYLAPRKATGEKGRRRKEGWFKIYSPPQTGTASPAQLHRRPGPVWPIRMICLLSFHHPPQDNAGEGGGRSETLKHLEMSPSPSGSKLPAMLSETMAILLCRAARVSKRADRARSVVPRLAFITQTVTPLQQYVNSLK